MNVLLNRRHLLFGAACVGALGTAEVLRPRKTVSLLGKAKLDDAIPRTLPGWISHDVTDLVAPKVEGSLASRIYEQTVGRVYSHAASGFEVMMLAAYGETQSRDLQLHRPEQCYPAVGFKVTETSTNDVDVRGVRIPTRRLVAVHPGRQETIVYWSRLGDYIPVGGMEQRLDVLKMSMAGYFADGLLMRLSSLGTAPQEIYPQIDGFISDLVSATPMAFRPVLVGTPLAKAIG